MVKRFKSNTRYRQRAARPTNREERRENAAICQKNHQRKNNINRQYTFASFIEGAHNQFARAAALSAVDSLGKKAFNPLVIYGGVGMGKTHLLHAIANKIIQEKKE